MQEDLRKALIKYNKKTWCKSALLGFFVGLAVIVPGISGSTVAIIFKLYDAFLYAVSNLFRQFKRCFFFLLPIAIGIVIGLAVGFFTVQKALEYIPFAIVGGFAGLMCGAFPAVKDELKGAKRTGGRVALFIAGVCIPVAAAICSVMFSGGAGKDLSVWWRIVLCLPVGAVVGLTQVVPGLSASAILMSIGYFTPLVESVHVTYWKANPMIFLTYAALGIGFLIGIFFSSGALTRAFRKARHTAYSIIVGLSLGSIIAMFCNVEIFAVYKTWAANGIAWKDLWLGVALFITGAAISYLLVRYQRGKDAEANAAKAAEAAEIQVKGDTGNEQQS